VLKLTGSGFYVGLLTAFQFGPILLLSAWGGAIADRSDKRKLLMVTQSLEMVESAGLAVLAFMPHPPVAGLFALALIGGTLLAFDNPLRRSFVTEMVPPGDIPNAVVLYSTIVNTARVLGPALAGLLVVTVGYGWSFAIDAATYLAVLYCLYVMRPGELFRQPPRPRAKGEIRAGIRYVASVPVLWISFAMLGAIGVLAYNFNVTLPLLVINGLHGTEGTFTILYSVFGLGAITSSLIVAHQNLVSMKNIIFGSAALGVTMLALSAVPGTVAAVPVIFLTGMASILYMTATAAMVQVEARPDMHGRVLALQTVLLVGTAPIGGPLLGSLADLIGTRLPITMGGVACLLVAIFGYWAARRYDVGMPAHARRVAESIED
jgi:MFS family permease